MRGRLNALWQRVVYGHKPWPEEMKRLIKEEAPDIEWLCSWKEGQDETGAPAILLLFNDGEELALDPRLPGPQPLTMFRAVGYAI